MRLASPLFETYSSPEEWVQLLQKHGYRAAYSPVRGGESDAEIAAYGRAAKAAGIVIAEVGVWECNALSPDETERRRAIERCKRGLAVAELLQARCCVTLAGSRGAVWCGPHPDNLSDETFAMVVENAREIIDAVQPQHTFFALEPMPWTFPVDVDSHLRLIEAVDRKAFAVHFDPANMVYSPQRYFHNGQFIADFVARLGRHIRVVHCKDIRLADTFIFHVGERIPGQGDLDYPALLNALATLDEELPLLTEHLTTWDEYAQAEAHIKKVAAGQGLQV